MRVITLLFFAVSFTLLAQPKVELRQTPNAAYGHYLKEVLGQIYPQVGYSIEYVNLPFVREVDMAVKSQIGGVLARDLIIEQSAPELVRVDVPLFSYEVVMLLNTEVCGDCLLDNMNIVAYPRGGKIYQSHIDELPERINKVAISGATNLIQMLEKGRVDGVVFSDILLPQTVLDNPSIMIVVLEKRFDYHYLSPSKSHLKKPLEQALLRMTGNGQLATLKRKYQLQ